MFGILTFYLALSECPDFSDKKVFVNPVRQRLVQKMELYDEGRILTSELLSSGASLCECPNQL